MKKQKSLLMRKEKVNKVFSWKEAAIRSGKKEEHKPKLWVRISSGGVGVFHVKGWGLKSWVCPS